MNDRLNDTSYMPDTRSIYKESSIFRYFMVFTALYCAINFPSSLHISAKKKLLVASVNMIFPHVSSVSSLKGSTSLEKFRRKKQGTGKVVLRGRKNTRTNKVSE